MKALFVKSFIIAAAAALLFAGLNYLYAITYVPTPDGNDSDLRGAGAMIYASPYLFIFLFLLLLSVGSIGRLIRNMRNKQ
jgi:hypothetical protein